MSKDVKDTLKNRMRAIEACTGSDAAFDIDCSFMRHGEGQEERYKLLSREKLEELYVEASAIINQVWALSHGHNSNCCKGRGKELIEPAIKSYF
jgi:hypothetical protein